jgi:hypothetical protein
MTDQPYAIYAIRCADGSRYRHPVGSRRSVRDLVLQQAARLVDKPCGPHVIDYAIVQPLDWAPLDLSVPDPQMVGHAQNVTCPRCGVPAGSDCENLISRRAGTTKFTSWPQTVGHAQSVACPRCGVPAGAGCENLISRRAGTTKFTSWPHPERITAASGGAS